MLGGKGPAGVLQAGGIQRTADQGTDAKEDDTLDATAAFAALHAARLATELEGLVVCLLEVDHAAAVGDGAFHAHKYLGIERRSS